MKFFTIAALLAPLAALVAADGTITIQAAKKGQLYVKLNRATDLTNKDLIGKSDPFIEMWLDKAYKQRSKDTKGLNPIFDQTFCFYVRPGQNKLYIRVVDKDTFRNDKIGDGKTPLFLSSDPNVTRNEKKIISGQLKIDIYLFLYFFP